MGCVSPDTSCAAAPIIVADKNLNTLVDFRYKRKFVAKRGNGGGASNCTGAAADDVIVRVPMGTLVKDDMTGVILADLTEDGQQFRAAKGGRGGKGNACYVTSTNRAPTFAEKGEPGTSCWLKLELKLLADVGLVGYPSVGKSSIISRVSAAKPEIADNPEFLFKIVSISSGVKHSFFIKNVITDGSKSPLLVTIGIPPNGVNPILVSTDFPPLSYTAFTFNFVAIFYMFLN